MIHIVFDLDGTLADTQDIHQAIESEFLLSKWVNIAPIDIGKNYAGRSPTEWIPECLHSYWVHFLEEEIQAFVDSKDQKVIELLHQDKIWLISWVQETLDFFKMNGCKMGISSWACREFIDEFIEHFSLNMIEASTSANEVVNKKPAPDVFLSSFEKLEKVYGKPSEKWVVWDGKTDIIGWKAAWAKTVLCYNNYNTPHDYRINNFTELMTIIKKK
jgi:beta-phosphoglucomutase-like phosphatase (HAD superfamily)